MDNKNGAGPGAMEKFFAGKGFYIVLLLCAVVIGVSAWTLLVGTDVDDRISEVGVAGVVVTPEAENTPAPSTAPESAKPQTTPTPAPTEAMSPASGLMAATNSKITPVAVLTPSGRLLNQSRRPVPISTISVKKGCTVSASSAMDCWNS